MLCRPGGSAAITGRFERPLRLKSRADFLAAAKGSKVHRDAFTLQARRRVDEPRAGLAPRIGFTVTKKVGNAVTRNRIRRRLRALADRLAGEFDRATDYVIVARVEALEAPFDRLGSDLSTAILAAEAKLRSARPGRSEPRAMQRPHRPPTNIPPETAAERGGPARNPA